MTQAVSQQQAILFLRGHEVLREMHMPEFEAVLDHVVNMPDYCGKTARLIYVEIDERLKITAAVFFQLPFDQFGYSDPDWNIPLASLAGRSPFGPDLGAGRIKLACRSRCEIPWLRRQLWQPDTEQIIFKHIVKIIQRNRLAFHSSGETVDSDSRTQPGLEGHESQRIEPVSEKVDKTTRQQLSELSQNYKLKLASLKTETREHLQKVHNDYRETLLAVNKSLETSQQLFKDEKAKNQQLTEQLRELQAAHKAMEIQFQQSLDVKNYRDAAAMNHLREQYDGELERRLASELAELKGQIDARDMEDLYREQKVTSMQQEIQQLREDKRNLLAMSGDSLLQSMVDKGITFLVQPLGEEAMTISLSEVSTYLESPNEFLAHLHGVSGDHYRQWLAHYTLPLCTHKSNDQKSCGKALPRVDNPGFFIAQKSDRCPSHAHVNHSFSEFLNLGGASHE